MNRAWLVLVWSVIAFSAVGQSNKGAITLSPQLRETIVDALAGEDGEYAARAKYAAMVSKFGAVQPYTYIRSAENYHILALETHLRKAGLTPPTDRFLGKVTAPATLSEAAAEGVRIEEKTCGYYERLLSAASGDAELTRIVTNLLRMTRDGHLAAFRAAVESGGSLTAEQIRARAWMKRKT